MNTAEIKNISLYNIGKKNYEQNCYDLIKNEKPDISCKNLEKIIYENQNFNVYNSEDIEQIKTFINLFFYMEKYLYYSSEVFLNDTKANKTTLQYLFFNISNFNDLMPVCTHKDNVEINLKLYNRNIII